MVEAFACLSPVPDMHICGFLWSNTIINIVLRISLLYIISCFNVLITMAIIMGNYKYVHMYISNWTYFDARCS